MSSLIRIGVAGFFAGIVSLYSPALIASNTDFHDCLIEPNVVSQVGTPVQGVISQLLVDRGDIVEIGQAIATLNSSVERANLDQATARAKMNSELQARQADLSLAQVQMDRMLSLHKKKMVSAQQRDEARAQLSIARAAVAQARDNMELLSHDLERNQRILDLKTIRSPIEGIVVEVQAFPGEFIYDNPVMTIAQINPLRVEVVLPATEFGKYRQGTLVQVYPELAPDQSVDAEIKVLDGLLDSFSGTFGVRLELSNPDMSITSGQKCQVVFPDENRVSSTD